MKRQIQPTVDTLKIGDYIEWPNGDVWTVDTYDGTYLDFNEIVPDFHIKELPALFSLPYWFENVPDEIECEVECQFAGDLVIYINEGFAKVGQRVKVIKL